MGRVRRERAARPATGKTSARPRQGGLGRGGRSRTSRRRCRHRRHGGRTRGRGASHWGGAGNQPLRSREVDLGPDWRSHGRHRAGAGGCGRRGRGRCGMCRGWTSRLGTRRGRLRRHARARRSRHGRRGRGHRDEPGRGAFNSGRRIIHLIQSLDPVHHRRIETGQSTDLDVESPLLNSVEQLLTLEIQLFGQLMNARRQRQLLPDVTPASRAGHDPGKFWVVRVDLIGSDPGLTGRRDGLEPISRDAVSPVAGPGRRRRRAGYRTGRRLNGHGWTTGPAGPCRRRAHAGPHWKSSGHGTSLARPSFLPGCCFEREGEEGDPEGWGAADGWAAEFDGGVAGRASPPSRTASVTIRMVSP